jgi:hypothetical protein
MIQETIKKLRLYNKWRRGDEELPQPDPREIGLWIDEICNYAEEVGAKCDQLRIDAQREAEHHDRMVGELEKVYDERDEARRLAEAMAEKAKALVARWDQPSWKDVSPTAGFIYDLRNAVAAYEAVKK